MENWYKKYGPAIECRIFCDVLVSGVTQRESYCCKWGSYNACRVFRFALVTDGRTNFYLICLPVDGLVRKIVWVVVRLDASSKEFPKEFQTL